MEARDADALGRARDFDVEKAAGGERQFVLGDLVALGQIGIEIVFAGEPRMLVDRAIEGKRGAHGHLDGALVQNGKRARKAEADGADVSVRRIAEPRGAAAEDLRFGEELDVDFKTDDGLVFRQDFGRDRHGLWSGFGHSETKIIASAGGTSPAPTWRAQNG